jgi:ATPase
VKEMEIKKLIADTSIIIDGKISEFIEKNKFEKLEEVIIPIIVLDELQAQASRGKEPGFVGLNELKKIRKLCEEKKIDLRFTGDRPSLEDIKLARGGRLDAIIRDVAKSENGTLVTADYVQGLVAEAEGVKVEYIVPEVKTEGLTFEKYFTPDTMSVHLKEKVVPMAKRGKPGEFKLQKIAKETLTREELQKMIYEIVEAARKSEDSFIEAERGGGVIVQMGIYRIAIAKPPFSDGFEITIVRPIVKLSMEDYKMSDKLISRLKEKAEGILIAGPPGSGKTTFAASLAEFYFNQGKIVKTLECPRDLQVGPEITQYGPLAGDFAKTADLLLLVRPDYSIFDEVRQADHFRIFADMRLAGVGMVGVVHASEAIDAVQRFIGKIELGMIPHVIDTVIFIKDGEIKNVYDLLLIVKVPTGMTEADLTRPVVEVRDFETGKLYYEIYTYGDENVVVPIKEKEAEPAVRQLAKQRVKQIIDKYDPDAEVGFISDSRVKVVVDNDVIARLIGKNGTNITEIEKKLGLHIDVEPKVPTTGLEVGFSISEIGNSLVFQFEPRMKGKKVDIYVDSDYLLSATVGKNNEVKVSKSSGIGKEILKGMIGKKIIRVLSV